mmetsp:Transcript_27120/g.58054  ORF Transcript_27120/g.58054 Transcript_27120/m.58054 type:complete len:124 (+) Transcript_27120:173-544(+)
MNSNDDDLYGDLDLTLENVGSLDGGAKKKQKLVGSNANERDRRRLYISPTHKNHDQVSREDSVSIAAKMKKENESLRERMQNLEEENLRLKRNIGIIFRTAKNEIRRKDDQIDRLQREQEQRY